MFVQELSSALSRGLDVFFINASDRQQRRHARGEVHAGEVGRDDLQAGGPQRLRAAGPRATAGRQ